MILAGGVLHDIVRLGGVVEPDEWTAVSDCEGPLAPLRVELGRAIVDGRAGEIAAVADGSSKLGVGGRSELGNALR